MPAGSPNTLDYGPIGNIKTMADLRQWLQPFAEKLRFTIEHMVSDITVTSEGLTVSIGPTETDGSWRIRNDGVDLWVEVNISGTWTPKFQFKRV